MPSSSGQASAGCWRRACWPILFGMGPGHSITASLAFYMVRPSAINCRTSRCRGVIDAPPDACPGASNRIVIRSLASSERYLPSSFGNLGDGADELLDRRYFQDVAGCARPESLYGQLGIPVHCQRDYCAPVCSSQLPLACSRALRRSNRARPEFPPTRWLHAGRETRKFGQESKSAEIGRLCTLTLLSH